jgi:flagellar basal body-associated protein FliL
MLPRRRRPIPEIVALGVLVVLLLVVALLLVAVVVVTFWPVATALAVVLGCALVARHLYRWKGRAAQHEKAQALRSVPVVDPDAPEAF